MEFICELKCFTLYQCPLWGFRYSETEVGNVYRGLLVDTMHQTDQGKVFKFWGSYSKLILQNDVITRCV